MKKYLLFSLSLLVWAGCENEATTTASQPDGQLFPPGKSDTPSVCNADDELVTCLSTQCPDVTGPDLDTCFEDNCADSAENTPDDCSECVVGGFGAGFSGAGIATACAGAADSGQSCSTNEPVLTCINANCAGVVGDAFDTCFEDNCEADATDTPIPCALCIGSGFEAGLDAEAITEACTGASAGTPGAELTGVACSGDDQQLFACINNNCPDADTSDSIGECIADSCSTEAQATTVPCLVCVDGHLSSGATSPEDACEAADSAPCTVAVATALQECANGACAGKQGDALDECMDIECPDAFDGVTEACGSCVIGLNQGGVPLGDAAGVCAGG